MLSPRTVAVRLHAFWIFSGVANGLRTEFRHSGMSAFCARAFSFRVSFRFRASSAFEVVKSVGSHRFSVLVRRRRPPECVCCALAAAARSTTFVCITSSVRSACLDPRRARCARAHSAVCADVCSRASSGPGRGVVCPLPRSRGKRNRAGFDTPSPPPVSPAPTAVPPRPPYEGSFVVGRPSEGDDCPTDG